MFEWFLSLLPANLLIALGAAGIVAFVVIGKLPIPVNFKIYRWAALGVGIVLVALGLFTKGAEHERVAWELKVKQAEERVAIAEEKARTASAKVETVFVDRVKEVVKNRTIIKDKIVVVTERIDQQCKLDPVVLEIHNAAAKNEPLPEVPK